MASGGPFLLYSYTYVHHTHTYCIHALRVDPIPDSIHKDGGNSERYSRSVPSVWHEVNRAGRTWVFSLLGILHAFLGSRVFWLLCGGVDRSRRKPRESCIRTFGLRFFFWELDGWMGKNEAEKEVEKKSATPPGISGTQ